MELISDQDKSRIERTDCHLRVASHIVYINTQQVSQAVGHEGGAKVDLQHVLHAASKDADLHQLLQLNPVSQTVHVTPLYTFRVHEQKMIL